MKKLVIPGIFTLVAAVIAGIFGLVQANINKPPPASQPPSPIPSEPPHSTPVPTPACVKRAAITTPTTGAEIDGIQGVKVGGTVCGLGAEESVWLFDFDPYDQNYYLVYDPEVGPQAVADSNDTEFAMLDQPIGDPGDQRKKYVITAVVATAACADELRKKKPDGEGNYVFHPLPPTCEIRDQRQIFESQR